MRSKSVLFLFVLFVLFPEKGFAHPAGPRPCTGILSLAFDIGLSTESVRESKLGIPDLGVEVLGCVSRDPVAEYAPKWIGLRFSYSENLLGNRLVRDYDFSTPLTFPIRNGFEFSMYPKLTVSKFANDLDQVRFSVQGGGAITVLPWRVSVPDNNTILGGVFLRLASEFGFELIDSVNKKFGVGANVGYRFGGT